MRARSGHAVVIGGSMAGLVTARVLADRFEVVTIVERDELPGGPQTRKGVPQGRHAHGLLAAGEQVLAELFPGIVDELVDGGAVRLDFAPGARWFQAGGYRTTTTNQQLYATFFSRPFLEDVVRRRVLALDNVTLRPGSVATLATRHGAVAGVALADGTELASDLVVDASGRGSQATRWMEALGYDAPPVSHVKIDMGYATRLLRRTPDHPQHTAIVTISAPADGERLGVMFPIEGDRWILTLCGFHGDHSPTDDDGFLAFAESLPTPDIADVLRTAEPLTPVMTHRLPSSQWRHFERCKRVPAGFLALGDSICSFNPIYGQGMSSAALQAATLGKVIDKVGAQSPRLPKAFYAKAKKVISVPWQIAAGADFTMPETTGPKPPLCNLINRYLANAFVAAQHDAVVNDQIARVQNLLALPPSLLTPRMQLRVRRFAKRGPVGLVRAEPGPGRQEAEKIETAA
jgi:2-polyprenyl-6-methoxyphenol hydroxylase-like FAD-dependent oxidoreductase